MGCDRYREAISAQIDGEDPGVARDDLDRHLIGCGPCRQWSAHAHLTARTIRVHAVATVPDLTDPILAAIAAERLCAPPIAPITAPARPGEIAPTLPPARPRALTPARRRALAGEPAGLGAPTTPAVVRVALGLVAAAQVAVALPALGGNDLGAPVHVAHEQAAWGLALAAGLALGAWRPGRAAGLFPLVAVFVGCLTVLGLADIGAGRAVPSAEVPHLMSLVGLTLLWLVSHPPAGLAPTAGPPPPRRPAPAPA